MSTLTPDDVKEQAVERDSNGEIIPETHTIEWGDEEKNVKTVPITTGVVNELSHIDEEIANLEPAAVYEAFKTLYIEPSPDEFTEQDIRDLSFPYLEALMKPLDEKISQNIGGEGNLPSREERVNRR